MRGGRLSQAPSGSARERRAAPSAELLRDALDGFPRDLDRDVWVKIGHAAKGAAVLSGIEAAGREIWLDWCAGWTGGAPDAAQDAAAWDSYTDPQTGWGTRVLRVR